MTDRTPLPTPARRTRSYCRNRNLVPRNTVLVGDATEQLARLPEHCVDAVITSPPYHLLRRYDAGPQEIGTETTVDDYVERIMAVCDQLARLLKPTGVLWLNLGDSYSRHHRYGAAPKSLLLAPEKILLALAARDWIPRSKVVWHKPNHLPTSVGDRLANAWEPIYLLARSRRYYFDLDAIRVPHSTVRSVPKRPASADGYDATKPQWAGPLAGANDGLARARSEGRSGHRRGKNPGDVWRIGTGSGRHGHRAAFPTRLITQPVLASVPERTCTSCGLAWTRPPGEPQIPLTATCGCDADWQPGLVLDPFLGSGTVGIVATTHHRDWLGIELNPKFAALARRRIAAARDP